MWVSAYFVKHFPKDPVPPVINIVLSFNISSSHSWWYCNLFRCLPSRDLRTPPIMCSAHYGCPFGQICHGPSSGRFLSCCLPSRDLRTPPQVIYYHNFPEQANGRRLCPFSASIHSIHSIAVFSNIIQLFPNSVKSHDPISLQRRIICLIPG